MQVQSLFNDIVEESEATVKSEDTFKRKREYWQKILNRFISNDV